MRLSEFCIKRPVFTIVIALVLVLFGILGYSYLHMRYMPKVFKPTVIIDTSYPGASAKLVGQSVTDVLEPILAQTPDLDYMHSKTSEGRSHIALYFKAISKQNFMLAFSQVQREVAQRAIELPQGVQTPMLTMGGFSAGNFLMAISITDANMSAASLHSYVHQHFAMQLQHLPGVSTVFMSGFSTILRVAVNPQKLAAYHISLSQLEQVLDDNNARFPVGQIINKTQQIPINAVVPMNSIAAFKNLVIQNDQGQLIRLKDIAQVSIAPLTQGGAIAQLDGKRNQMMWVIANNDANPIDVGHRVLQAINTFQSNVPPGMTVEPIWNLTRVLKSAVHDVFNTIIEALILVCLVILLFLGRWRVALIPIVTIPVCLLSAFAFMFALGFTINILTLLAMVLAVGMVVDDAIVVLENTHRHVESGLSAMQAAQKSVGEISFAVIGMTICLLAVYAPVAFMHNQTAIYFQEFAFTLVSSILVSGFLALTLTPMMCGRILSPTATMGRYEAWVHECFERLRRRYQAVLKTILHRRWVVLLIFVVLIVFGGWLLTTLPSSLLPKFLAPVVQGYMASANSANADEAYAVSKPVLRQMQQLPAVAHLGMFDGGSAGANNMVFFFATLKDYDGSDRYIENVSKQINQMIMEAPGLSGGSSPVDLGHHTSMNSQGSMSFLVLSNHNYHTLSQNIEQLNQALRQTGLFSHLVNGLKFDDLTYNLMINRNLAASLGISLSTIDNTLSTFFGGYKLRTNYYLGAETYPIYLQLPKEDLADFSILQHIEVPDATDHLIPISRLVKVKQQLALPTREHFNQMRSGQVYATPNSSVPLGEAVKVIRHMAKQILPSGDSIQFVGSARQMLHNNHSMVMIFILGILFIFLVLAALFESFIDPLVILFTIPVCIVGALTILKITGGTLNTYTGIGLVTLIGLVSKHGILITQFANRLRKEGKSIYEAVVAAATIRLRPILMTTMTMVLGAVPLVLTGGPGHDGRAQIGWVIIAGLLIGTVFSLFIVPVMYSLLARLKRT